MAYNISNVWYNKENNLTMLEIFIFKIAMQKLTEN